MAKDWLKEVSWPVLFLYHLMGYQTLECPRYFHRYKLYRLVWNIPRVSFFLLLVLSLIKQMTMIGCISGIKSQLSVFIVTMLIVSGHICMFRSRRKIQLLLSKLSNVSKTIPSSGNLRHFIILYCCVMFGLNFSIEISNIKVEIKDSLKNRILESNFISEDLMPHISYLLDFSFVLTGIFMSLPSICFSGYYFIVCFCMKSILFQVASKSQKLAKQYGYLNILNIYEEVTEIMAFADHFLSYYALIYIMISMSGLFWFTYFLAFLNQEDYYSYMMSVSGIVYYLLIFLLVILSAAAANEAAEMAKSYIMFMESWIPERCRDSRIYLRQKLKPRVDMTLWKTYHVDKRFVISSLGTLLTYGILFGTLGSVNNPNNTTS